MIFVDSSSHDSSDVPEDEIRVGVGAIFKLDWYESSQPICDDPVFRNEAEDFLVSNWFIPGNLNKRINNLIDKMLSGKNTHILHKCNSSNCLGFFLKDFLQEVYRDVNPLKMHEANFYARKYD